MSKEIPIYLINGFLEAGKTSFINQTVSEPYFQIEDNTLIISMEDGEVEYDENFLKKYNAVAHVIKSKEELNSDNLKKLELEHNAGRIIIEHNIMWDCSIELPKGWVFNQQITIVDCSTFKDYFRNNDLKGLFMKLIKNSELIIFNRSKKSSDLKDYLRTIRAVNASVEVVFEDANQQPIEVRIDEDLPYDINKNKIELDDSSYGIWFVDMMEELEKYKGKTISMVGRLLNPSEKLEDNIVVVGRHVMTCCIEDIQFLGYPVRLKEALDMKDGSWVKLEAVINKDYFEGYQEEGPMLEAVSIEKTVKPKQELVLMNP